MSRMLTLKQAAERLGVTWKYVWTLAHAGKLAYSKFGPSKTSPIRIEADEVERFIAATRVRRPEPASKPPRKNARVSRTRAEECAALGIEPDHEFS